jgi:two-component system cell cycle sensor histidine kinase/response regulator CckA
VQTALRTVASVSVPEGERLVPAGQYVQLQVTDTGIGISSDHLQHVFEPFFTTKEVGKGTGLGLATVEGIIAQSRGYIWAESELGQGTRFTVLLPLESEPACAPVEHLPVIRPTHKPACVLLVEDEDAVRTLLARTLRNEGYEVVEAGHGRDALARLEEHGDNIALVLSDVLMPVMGGKELGERLAADHPDLPLIWMSGYAHDTAFLHGPSGHCPWLQKPVTPELLIESVQDLLKQFEGRAVVAPVAVSAARVMSAHLNPFTPS